MRENKFHSSYFFVLVISFFILVSFPFLYKISFVWSLTLFVFSIFIGLKIWDGLKIIFITFFFSYSVFLLFLFFPGGEYQLGNKVEILGFVFYQKVFDHALLNWVRLWSISLFSLSSAKVFDAEEFILFLMQKNKISKRLGYSVLVGINSIAGFRKEWKLVSLNLKLRGIDAGNPFRRVFPLLVYAFRSSYRKAMALRARGLNEKKTFYLKTEPNIKDLLIFFTLVSVLVLEFVLL